MEAEDGLSAPSTPVTPGTPGAPLFGGFRPATGRSGNIRRSSLLKSCQCFSVEALTLEEGSLPPVSCALPPPPVSLARKVGAEFIGLLGLAASTGLAVMIVILSTGHISGAHLNPSISSRLYRSTNYGIIMCCIMLKGIFHPIMGGGITVPSGGYVQAFALGFIITFNLMFVVTAVATDTRAVGELAELAVGATVMLNVLIAGETTGASMNPARTLGPAIAANNYKAIWVYLRAPILGALAGAGIYSAVKLPDEDANAHEKPLAAHSFRI